MTELQLEGKTEFEYVIPTLTKDKQPIPPARVESYIRAIESRSIQLNGGFKKFNNCEGGYSSKSGEIQYENLTIIQTYGQMPLSERDLEYFVDYLSQECLFVKVAGECEAYLHEGGKSQTTYS